MRFRLILCSRICTDRLAAACLSAGTHECETSTQVRLGVHDDHHAPLLWSYDMAMRAAVEYLSLAAFSKKSSTIWCMHVAHKTGWG